MWYHSHPSTRTHQCNPHFILHGPQGYNVNYKAFVVASPFQCSWKYYYLGLDPSVYVCVRRSGMTYALCDAYDPHITHFCRGNQCRASAVYVTLTRSRPTSPIKSQSSLQRLESMQLIHSCQGKESSRNTSCEALLRPNATHTVLSQLSRSLHAPRGKGRRQEEGPARYLRRVAIWGIVEGCNDNHWTRRFTTAFMINRQRNKSCWVQSINLLEAAATLLTALSTSHLAEHSQSPHKIYNSS